MAMRISKLLNTNAVMSKDRLGNELLLLGSGLGFKKHLGDEVDLSRVEKQFILRDKAHLSRMEEILSTIPADYVLLAEKAIDYAVNTYGMELNEIIHLSLVDHMYNAVCNYLDGVSIPNSIVDDIRRFYPNEYAAGRRALVLIKEKFGYQLPQDEIGFFAMHFVAAQQTEGNASAKTMLSFVHDINGLVQQKLGRTFDEDSLSYYRYMSHLKAFALRVMQDYHYPEDTDSDVLRTLAEQHPQEYKCSREICAYIREEYGYNTGTDEEIYLSVHLVRLVQSADAENGEDEADE